MAEHDDNTPEFKLTSPPASRTEERKARQRANWQRYESKPGVKAKRAAKQRERQRTRIVTPEEKAKKVAYQKEYYKTYRQTEKFKAYKKAYRQQNKERIKAKQKARRDRPEQKAKEKARRDAPEWKKNRAYYNRNRNHGLTKDEYDRMFRECKGACSICKTPFSSLQVNRIHVDHCHDSGKIRHLLCHVCNVGLGHFKDDPKLLRTAARYLEKFKAERS